MQWKSVDNREDLRWLDRAASWEDSITLEVYTLGRSERYFPEDISRSGYEHKNLHLLLEVDSTHGDYMHLVLVDCDQYSCSFIESPFFGGRVDGLKRVEVTDYKGATHMRCSRIIYRFLELANYPLDGLYLASELSS